MIKKLLVLSLAVQLVFPAGLFARQPDSPDQKTEEEIQRMISETDSYSIKISPVTAAIITTGVVLAGYGAVKLSYFLGDIKGFGRGYNAAKYGLGPSSEVVQRKGAKPPTTGTHAKNQSFVKPAGTAAKEVVTASSAVKSVTAKEVPFLITVIRQNEDVFSKELLKTLENLAAKNPVKSEVSVLLARLGKRLSLFSTLKTDSPVAFGQFKSAAEVTMKELSTAASDATPEIKKVIGELIDDSKKTIRNLEKNLGKKGSARGGVFGVILVVGVATTAYLLNSSEDKAKVISNKRALVEDDLIQTFKKTPELMAAKVLVFKEMYGLKFVSSVIYENQDLYGQAVFNQFETINSEEMRETIAAIEDELMQDELAYQISISDKDLAQSVKNRVALGLAG